MKASSATTTGNRTPESRRSSIFQPTTRATPRSAFRNSAIAATCDIWGRLEATCRRQAESGQGLWKLHVRHGAEPGGGLPCHSGKPLHRWRRTPCTTARARSGYCARCRLPNGRWILDEHAGPVRDQHSRRLSLQEISDRQHIVVLADIFNLFNRQIPLDYDPNTETTFQVVNPDFGDASRFNLSQLETPRQMRIGIRYQF